MPDNVVLSARNLSKFYRLYEKPFDRVKESLIPFSRDFHKRFYAAKEISLEVRRGETLGIIGKNGHGKSTLLKMIAGVLTPSSGAVRTKGKVAAILELTSNLRPELTGLQNIELNLKISGCTNSAELAKKTNSIIEFADLGHFINQPVRIYSSGMKSRLGFGIATDIEHDILILDEVLAVGDFEFQQKCLAKINELRDNIAVLFVSHSMNSVRLFCDRAILLEHGVVTFDGGTEDAIGKYLNSSGSAVGTSKSTGTLSNKKYLGDIFQNNKKAINIVAQWDRDSYRLHDEMTLSFSFEMLVSPRDLVIGVPVWNELGELITSFNTDLYNLDLNCKGRFVKGTLKMSCIFNPSAYDTVMSIYDKGECLYRDIIEGFTVQNKERVFGFVTPDARWEIDE